MNYLDFFIVGKTFCFSQNPAKTFRITSIDESVSAQTFEQLVKGTDNRVVVMDITGGGVGRYNMETLRKKAWSACPCLFKD